MGGFIDGRLKLSDVTTWTIYDYSSNPNLSHHFSFLSAVPSFLGRFVASIFHNNLFLHFLR